MSGLFQRPQLQVDTFQVYNEPEILNRGALKNLFERRNMSGSSIFNLNSSISIQSQQTSIPNEGTDLDNIQRQDDICTYPLGYHSIHRLDTLGNQQGGSNLKRAFEARMGGTMRRTLGRSDKHKLSLEKHANLIVSKMEQDKTLMEDSPTGGELRKVALRDMPQCLTIKRCVKVKLSKSVSQKSKKKTLSCYKMFKYQAGMAISKLKVGVIDLAYSFELWYDALKKIEGNFGTGVSSFFRFLRWLFLVNVIIALISFLFIVFPYVIDGNIGDESNNNSDNITWDLLTGEGYFANTIMYYGYYVNKTIPTIGSLTYSIPNAYFLTMALIYILSIVYFGWSTAKSYKRSFIETEGGLKNVFANKIFCGWDFNIATKAAADLKSKAIYNELKELINDFAWKKRQLTFLEKARIRIIQFFTNVLVLFIMVVMGYAIWEFLDEVQMPKETHIVVVPLFINIVMMFMPMMFSVMAKYEDYKNPNFAMLLTLLRTSVLGIVTIGVLTFYWLNHKNDNKDTDCWENSLGQEMYRMIIFDFFISVLFAAILDGILYGIYKWTKSYDLEFDIAWNTMHIIYNQSLFWVGLIFVPLLPIIIIIKLFLIWYIRQTVVLYLCRPSSKTWRAASTSTWFLTLTFVSLLLVGVFLGYLISYVEVSNTCGPFRNFDYLIDVVTEGLLQLKSNSSLWSIILWFAKPGFIALIIIGMCGGVYILHAKANAQKETVAQYRNMLLWSAKDKEYYYNLISKFTDNQNLTASNNKEFNPELHQPEHNSHYEGGDIRRGASSSSFTFQPSTSFSTIEPSSSMSLDWEDNGHGRNPKKRL
ncbi:transmembrane channel-like protein 7 isoform X1 [Rhynchophorus ferrugineus]|uniref:transmembrane channel-like protein 7 isoform X1 n=2 Tax=Rhynchophorus ferrugineus TaxID=354439 RepID=UPI003FCEE62D